MLRLIQFNEIIVEKNVLEEKITVTVNNGSKYMVRVRGSPTDHAKRSLSRTLLTEQGEVPEYSHETFYPSEARYRNSVQT